MPNPPQYELDGSCVVSWRPGAGTGDVVAVTEDGRQWVDVKLPSATASRTGATEARLARLRHRVL